MPLPSWMLSDLADRPIQAGQCFVSLWARLQRTAQDSAASVSPCPIPAGTCHRRVRRRNAAIAWSRVAGDSCSDLTLLSSVCLNTHAGAEARLFDVRGKQVLEESDQDAASEQEQPGEDVPESASVCSVRSRSSKQPLVRQDTGSPACRWQDCVRLCTLRALPCQDF